MPKNGYFCKKSCKIATASGNGTPVGLRRLGALPQTPTMLLSPNAVDFVECVSSIERTLLLREIRRSNIQYICFGFVFSALSCLSSLQTLQFLLVWAQKYFLFPSDWYPIATHKIIGLG